MTPDTLYNIWGHAYGLEALARGIAREKDPTRREALRAAASAQVEALRKFRFVEGGWGYYNFDVQSKDPGPGSTTFTTATVLVALKMAADQGVAVPPKLIPPAVALLKLLRRPDWAYDYSYDWLYYPHGRINQPKGSLARALACDHALKVWGDPVPKERAVEALDRLETWGHFLLIARKYPIPHETWYQNSGYFCFYGYYYAALLAEASLEPAERTKYQDQIAARLLPLQEEDGSYWDYQIYGYHKAYGTGYVLMTLARCRH